MKMKMKMKTSFHKELISVGLVLAVIALLLAQFLTADSKMVVSKLFHICLQYVANNVCLVESFVNFPEDIGKQIFDSVDAAGKFDLETTGASLRALSLFTNAYTEVLMAVSIEGEHLMLANCLEHFMLFAHLRALNVGSCGLGDEHELLRHVSTIESLQILSLSNNSLTDEGIRKFTAPIRIKKVGPLCLQTLDLSDNQEISVKSLKFLRVFAQLQLLNLSSTNIQAESALKKQSMQEVQRHASSQSLVVKTQLTDRQWETVSDLTRVVTRGWAASTVQRWIQQSQRRRLPVSNNCLSESKTKGFYGRRARQGLTSTHAAAAVTQLKRAREDRRSVLVLLNSNVIAVSSSVNPSIPRVSSCVSSISSSASTSIPRVSGCVSSISSSVSSISSCVSTSIPRVSSCVSSISSCVSTSIPRVSSCVSSISSCVSSISSSVSTSIPRVSGCVSSISSSVSSISSSVSTSIPRVCSCVSSISSTASTYPPHCTCGLISSCSGSSSTKQVSAELQQRCNCSGSSSTKQVNAELQVEGSQRRQPSVSVCQCGNAPLSTRDSSSDLQTKTFIVTDSVSRDCCCSDGRKEGHVAPITFRSESTNQRPRFTQKCLRYEQDRQRRSSQGLVQSSSHGILEEEKGMHASMCEEDLLLLSQYGYIGK